MDFLYTIPTQKKTRFKVKIFRFALSLNSNKKLISQVGNKNQKVCEMTQILYISLG